MAIALAGEYEIGKESIAGRCQQSGGVSCRRSPQMGECWAAMVNGDLLLLFSRCPLVPRSIIMFCNAARKQSPRLHSRPIPLEEKIKKRIENMQRCPSTQKRKMKKRMEKKDDTHAAPGKVNTLTHTSIRSYNIGNDKNKQRDSDGKG